MSAPVVTRFAPSPTGFLHIGGARTALFNWLYAKHAGGKMLLRIEDTDRARSTGAAVEAILDGLSWLGLDWDGEPVSQFSRAFRHREIAEELVARGKAYRAYETPEELAAMREQAKAAGGFARYDGRWRDRDPAEAPQGVPPVIRIKAPREGVTAIGDHVQGRVAFPNKDLDDFIILRSDGTPTYMHAVVVDDHDMGVTHVIRGDDHLTNAGRQALIYEAMDWPIPQWAHIPLIHGPDGAKLSKRHGALGVEAYRAMGYLPEALRNYLARLGWSHGDDEVFSTEEAIEWFELGDINKAASRFDFAKLQNLNSNYIRAADDAYLLQRLESILPELPGGPEFAARLDDAMRGRLLALMPVLKGRAKTLVDLLESTRFLIAARPLALDDKAAALLDSKSRALLRGLLATLRDKPWSAADLEATVKAFAEREGVSLGTVAQPLRAALTGSATSPPIFDVLNALGEEESLRRIEDQMNHA
jgi:glutamyl-tRNA synthetase